MHACAMMITAESNGSECDRYEEWTDGRTLNTAKSTQHEVRPAASNGETPPPLQSTAIALSRLRCYKRCGVQEHKAVTEY
ncbi:unnamed protein product [Toxocara canis]|uniref:Uncharacterized protein n=1 Tax=Toxocara canis TaxID=6265 RepID=A0A183TYN5_TOXCA|nr:unnamed protein product [Toxocara canis]